MKKLLLMIAMVAVGFTANAQDGKFNLGANLVYDFDAEVFGLMGEANYLFDLSDEFKLGPAVSYVYGFGRDLEVNGVKVGEIKGSGSFIAAAAARFNASEEFVIGADLGYHTDAEDFYYRPLVGYNISENTMIQLSYPATTSGGSLALGVAFGL